MRAIAMHASRAGHAEGHLPLSFDAAMLALLVGLIVFGVILCDVYRVHWWG